LRGPVRDKKYISRKKLVGHKKPLPQVCITPLCRVCGRAFILETESSMNEVFFNERFFIIRGNKENDHIKKQ
jgi:hypothetical protein